MRKILLYSILTVAPLLAAQFANAAGAYRKILSPAELAVEDAKAQFAQSVNFKVSQQKQNVCNRGSQQVYVVDVVVKTKDGKERTLTSYAVGQAETSWTGERITHVVDAEGSNCDKILTASK